MSYSGYRSSWDIEEDHSRKNRQIVWCIAGLMVLIGLFIWLKPPTAKMPEEEYPVGSKGWCDDRTWDGELALKDTPVACVKYYQVIEE